MITTIIYRVMGCARHHTKNSNGYQQTSIECLLGARTVLSILHTFHPHRSHLITTIYLMAEESEAQ